MNRLFIALVAAAFIAGAGVAQAQTTTKTAPAAASAPAAKTAASKSTESTMAGPKNTMGKHKGHVCPPGKSWVHGYTTKKGTHVKGYCR